MRDKYRQAFCPSCQTEKLVRMKVCDSCYRKTRKAVATLPCFICSKLRPTDKQGKCHTCYERERRRSLQEMSLSNPMLRAKLKRQSRKHYLTAKSNGHYSSLSRRVSSALNAFKTRDPSTDINAEWFLTNIVGAKCHYCGIDEPFAKIITGQNLNVDKKNPANGYMQSNCVPACKACNTAKLNLWTEQQAKKLGQIIAELYKEKATG